MLINDLKVTVKVLIAELSRITVPLVCTGGCHSARSHSISHWCSEQLAQVLSHMSAVFAQTAQGSNGYGHKGQARRTFWTMSTSMTLFLHPSSFMVWECAIWSLNGQMWLMLLGVWDERNGHYGWCCSCALNASFSSLHREAVIMMPSSTVPLLQIHP